MSLRQLSYVIELAEAGSIRQAADNLNITHSGLVLSIQALEEQYGIRLFDRGRGVKATLTEAGKVFVSHARTILHQEDDLQNDLDILRKPGLRLLNLVFAPYPMEICGRTVVSALKARYPELRIMLSLRQYEQIKNAVLARQMHIGIAELANITGHPELKKEPLGNHIAGFFCRPNHPLLQKKRLNIGDILQYHWCCTKLPSRVGDFLPGDLGRAGSYNPQTHELIPAVEIESVANLKVLIGNTDLLCVAPLVLLKQELIANELVVLPYHDTWLATNYGFIFLKNRMIPPVVKEFMDEWRKVEKELFEEEKELVATYLKCATIQ